MRRWPGPCVTTQEMWKPGRNLALALLAVLAAPVVLPGCEAPLFDGPDDGFPSGKADGAIEEGSPEARAVLALANDPAVSIATLDDQAGLYATAAKNIVVYRDGKDTVPGTSDDRIYANLRELDDIKYVGPVALGQLLTYATEHGYLQADSDIRISATKVSTTADGGKATFAVRLETVPTDHVIIRLDTSDADQAVVYPQKINFCKPGYDEQPNGCEPIDPKLDVALESWSRTVEVSVTGVRSLHADGDVPFEISMWVESADEHYASIELAAIEGNNLGDAPAPNWNEIAVLQGSALLGALYERTRDHAALGYSGQNSARNVMFSVVDVHEGKIESLYTGATIQRSFDSAEAFQQGFNTEHTWPQSQFDKAVAPQGDLHHIFPCDITSNGKRSSYDFGMVNPTSSISLLGPATSDGRAPVYQVRPERRGDVARAHFYLVARYGHDLDLGISFDDDDLAANGSINDIEEAVLRTWHAQDPVDDLERIRNNRIEAFQGNRNPFIDRPDLVDQVTDF